VKRLGPVLARRVAEAADLVTVALDELLPRGDGPEHRLTEAMRYAALGPGKRLRPFYALEAGRMFDAPERPVLRAACALECVHAYSLIHDDLPCMDNDDERRGRPALHKAYDEATALLAGNALHAAAFEIMAHPDTHDDGAVRAELVRMLAVAAGARGMVGGQMIDRLKAGGDLGAMARMQRMKTGALISFAFDIPLILAGAGESERTALMGFAQDLGLAYQILDDLIAGEEDADLLGPTGSASRETERVNYVTLLGPDAARARIDLLADQARAHLDLFGDKAIYLAGSVDFVLELTG
jgi:farnesyl diphosphate synthase